VSRTLDFFFFLGSTYTYLSVMRIEEEAQAAGVEVRWRPFSVRQIMAEMQNVPFADKPAKLNYMWRDIERRSGKFGIPFTTPPEYPADRLLLANLTGTVAAEEGWCPEYTKASYRAWFLEGRKLGEPEHVRDVLSVIGQDPERVLDRASSEAIKARFDAETNAARRLGIFGSPTFGVGGEIFWGDDRLEDALEWARSHQP
jgi:2-hydroxychromene-2-carboxylate isomerase